MMEPITGTITRILPLAEGISQKTGNAWRSRAMLLQPWKVADASTGRMEPDQWNVYKFTFFGDRADILSRFAEGQMVKVDFDLSGRQYTNKAGELDAFVELRGWRVEDASGAYAAPAPSYPQKAPAPTAWPQSDRNFELQTQLMEPREKKAAVPLPGAEDLPF